MFVFSREKGLFSQKLEGMVKSAKLQVIGDIWTNYHDPDFSRKTVFSFEKDVSFLTKATLNFGEMS